MESTTLQIVEFLPLAQAGRYGSTFSIREGAGYLLTANGSRRAWSTYAAAFAAAALIEDPSMTREQQAQIEKNANQALDQPWPEAAHSRFACVSKRLGFFEFKRTDPKA